MEKEKIPSIKPYKGCKHKLILPLYARDQSENKWITTQKLTGRMIYICTKPDCGALLDKGFVERDAICEGDEK